MRKLLFLLLFPLVLCGAEPKLKIAVVSDIHEKWNDLDRVFGILSKKSPDAVLFGGDLANGNPESYRKYMLLYKKHFSVKKNPPVHIPIPGNHDYLGFPKGSPRPAAKESLKRFFSAMELPANWLQHHQVKGYTILGISATDDKGENRHSEAEIKQVSDLIGKAEKNSPGKPVFVMTHCPPAFTLLRSRFNSKTLPGARYHWRLDHVRKMLDGHPQAVSISGHTHLAIEDERSIWQGGFTAVHAGVLRWVTPQTPAPQEKTIKSLSRFGGRNFVYIEVFENKMIIYRFDANTLKEIKPQKRWVISLPHTPEKALYTAKRGEKNPAPRFPAGAKAEILRAKKHYCLQLDRAEHPDMVLAYEVRLIFDDKKYPEQKFFVSSDYFLHEKAEKRVLDIDEKIKLPSGAAGVMKITPYETFGKAGKILTSRFTVPK